MQLNLIYNFFLFALFRNCLNEMFTLTEVSKVSDAVNISRRLLRSNPRKWCAIFPPIFCSIKLRQTARIFCWTRAILLWRIWNYISSTNQFDRKEQITFHFLLRQTTNHVFEVLIDAILSIVTRKIKLFDPQRMF